MTPEQLAREATAAQTLSERLNASVQHGVAAALQDVRRRVLEEPWFGRTVNDLLAERQRGTEAFYASGKDLWEAVAGKEAAPEPEPPNDMQAIAEHLFGKDDGRDPGHDQGHGRGMER